MIERHQGTTVHGPRAARPRLAAGARSGASALRRAGFLAPAGLTLYLVLKGLHPGLPGWSCPLRALTGIPCPTCFLTRATAAALTGQLGDAVRWHAFGPLVAVGLLIWSWAAIRRRRVLALSIPDWSVGATALGLFLYWLLRLILEKGFGVPMFPSLLV